LFLRRDTEAVTLCINVHFLPFRLAPTVKRPFPVGLSPQMLEKTRENGFSAVHRLTTSVYFGVGTLYKIMIYIGIVINE
jgi:hypothetical protein